MCYHRLSLATRRTGNNFLLKGGPSYTSFQHCSAGIYHYIYLSPLLPSIYSGAAHVTRGSGHNRSLRHGNAGRHEERPTPTEEGNVLRHEKRNLSTNLKMRNSSLKRDIVFIFSSLLPTIVHKLLRISFFLACRTFKEYE